MTKRQVLDQYNADARGIIRTPGKFEAEPTYVPVFWDRVLDGSFEDEFNLDGDHYYVVTVRGSDRLDWSELSDCAVVVLWEDEQGFVGAVTPDADKLAAAIAQAEEQAADEAEAEAEAAAPDWEF